MKKIKIGIPKGSLQEQTLEIFKKAGYTIKVPSRSYKLKSDDVSIDFLLFRSQEISRYVESGVLDAGLCGLDWVLENESNVEQIISLNFSKTGYGSVSVVLAVPKGGCINSVQDLQGKRISTELVNVTKKYLQAKNISAEVSYSWGATEAKIPDIADAIVDLSETGSSLEANNLQALETILESKTVFVANKDAIQDSWKQKKIKNLSTLLVSAINAYRKVGLKMNIQNEKLDNLIKLLPERQKPTISRLSLEGWSAVEIVVDESIVRDILPSLLEIGAQDVIEYSLNKFI